MHCVILPAKHFDEVPQRHVRNTCEVVERQNSLTSIQMPHRTLLLSQGTRLAFALLSVTTSVLVIAPHELGVPIFTVICILLVHF